MRLKCLLLKLLLRADTRGQAIFELDSNSPQFPLSKEGKNRRGRSSGCFLTKTRGDCKKICGYNQGRSYSDSFRVSMDPRVTPVGDKRKKEPVGGGIKNVIARSMFTCDVAISAK